MCGGVQFQTALTEWTCCEGKTDNKRVKGIACSLLLYVMEKNKTEKKDKAVLGLDERFAVHREFRKRAEGASLVEVWVQADRRASADAVVGERLAY